jgi:5-methylcytosine-specific restriction protein B
MGMSRAVGIGVVKSGYLPPGSPKNPSQDKKLPHARLVDWLIDQPIELPRTFFSIPTICSLSVEKVDQIKEAYLREYPALKNTLDRLFPLKSSLSASDEATMKALLEQVGQIIIYGPPGTGKTREAKRVALALLTGNDSTADPTSADSDIEKQLKPFRDAGRFDLVVFHPAYEYEQFVGGIEPTVTERHLSFKAKAGVFTQLCRKAHRDSRSAVLIIDEINRGNLPKLLGELVYALEYRGHEVRLPFDDGDTVLIVPKNLYIIATMNSADRSIGHIDVAIRRRFGLYPLGARPEVVQQVWSSAGDEPYGVQLAALMKRLNEKLGMGHDPSAAVELGVGHSYFLPAPGADGETAKQQVQLKWAYQVQPLLREYAQLLNLGPDSLQEFLKTLDQCLAQP